ncbi:MAG: helix-turn-helix transcriptional regulator [Flavobacteriales bacterium]|nr:helix-turn-helix transcriptional regulator [Flavobacteriales bacterium]
MPSRFAEELRKLRNDQKLSQSAMAYKLHVDPSRISRWEHDELPPLNMVERISTTFGVNAHEWLHDSQKAPSADASAIEPRVVHMKPEPPRIDAEDSNWRSKAIDLLSRMTDLLESLIKNARGGGGK